MAENNPHVPNDRLSGGTRAAQNLMIVSAALGALISIPLILDFQGPSDEDGGEHTVFLLFAGLTACLAIAATVVKRTPFRQRRGDGFTDDELIAEMETQFEAGEPGPTI